MEQLLQVVVTGVLIGSVLALLSAGFSLVWGATGAINIAHTAISVGAAYLAYALLSRGVVGLSLSLLLSPLIGFLVGGLIYLGLVRPAAVRAREPALATLVITFGLALALENLLAAGWGPGPRVLRFSFSGDAIPVLGLRVPWASLLSALAAWLCLGALWIFLYHTYPGKAVRAVWQNPLGATLYGVDRDKVTLIAFGVSGASAAVGGIAMSTIYAFSPATHIEWLIWVFLIVIVGGVGSLYGAVLAGLLIGLLSTLVGLVVPFSWTPLLLFGILLVVILWRPSGLARF